jgi:nucleotide-binding universal stress UspA family protein
VNGTIICAVDGSQGVGAAVRASRELARRFDTRLLLVGFAGDSDALEGFEDEHRLATGDAVEGVARIADEEAADLIVVGARLGLFGRPVRSPLATELAATARCPVVVVPPDPAGAPADTPVRSSLTARLG